MDPILRIIEIDLVLREDIEVLLIIEIIKVETISFIIITIDKDMIMVIKDKQTDNYQIITGIIVGHQGIIDLHLGIGQCRIDTNVQDLNLQIIVMNVIGWVEIVIRMREMEVRTDIMEKIEIDPNQEIDKRDINLTDITEIPGIKINMETSLDIIERTGVIRGKDIEQEREGDHLNEDDNQIHAIIGKDQLMDEIEMGLEVDQHLGITV